MATFALDNLMSQFATDKEAKKSKGLILRAKDKRFQTPLSPQQSPVNLMIYGTFLYYNPGVPFKNYIYDQ